MHHHAVRTVCIQYVNLKNKKPQRQLWNRTGTRRHSPRN